MRVTIELDSAAGTAEIVSITPGEREVAPPTTARQDTAGAGMDAGVFGAGAAAPDLALTQSEPARSTSAGERRLPGRPPTHEDAFGLLDQGQADGMNAGSHGD